MLTQKTYTHIYNLTKSFNLHKFTHSSSLSPKSIIFQNLKITENGRNGNIKQVEHIFNQMPIKNVVSWIAMVSAYVENWDIGNARKVFDEMPERNVALWNAMIMGYMREKSGVDKGFELFGLMPERNAVMYAYVITGFVRSARVDKAREVYDGMCREWRDPFCSNALMNGHFKMGRLEDAVRVYEEMMVKNVVS
ncbi:tetratricopeptide repeat (TPR)-like superfamily protein [Artemisia annua]|uniref:Tetratricopeptide repeat (TPR)-like superfamily protein n=1 Tax=Artemisia annua TaxID=35608 RepID=A0A2U1MZA8_ARTAN|nr:tetratricopeptide repeat (TPR)-like superfamily protein [Artemisia annua]